MSKRGKARARENSCHASRVLEVDEITVCYVRLDFQRLKRVCYENKRFLSFFYKSTSSKQKYCLICDALTAVACVAVGSITTSPGRDKEALQTIVGLLIQTPNLEGSGSPLSKKTFSRLCRPPFH